MRMRREENCTQVLMEEWKELNDGAVQNAEGRLIFKWILKRQDVRGGIEQVGISCRLFGERYWTLVFHKCAVSPIRLCHNLKSINTKI